MKLNGSKPNNEQRRAWAKVVVNIYDQQIEVAKQRDEIHKAKVQEDVLSELGINLIDKQIVSLESQVEVLKKKRARLGMSQWNDGVIDGGKAQLLLDHKLSQVVEVKKIETDRDTAVARIWAAPTVKDAMEVVDKVIR